jgi:hypothetical protein
MERAEQEAKNRGCAAVALYTIIFLSDVITNADRWHKRFAFDGGITRRHPAQEGGPVHERPRHVGAENKGLKWTSSNLTANAYMFSGTSTLASVT